MPLRFFLTVACVTGSISITKTLNRLSPRWQRAKRPVSCGTCPPLRQFHPSESARLRRSGPVSPAIALPVKSLARQLRTPIASRQCLPTNESSYHRGMWIRGQRFGPSPVQEIEGLEILGLDNLSRPGSELNRAQFRKGSVRVVHGDIRNASDLEGLAKVDWVIDAAANPSVLAGINAQTSSRQLMEHNLLGTLNLARIVQASRQRLGPIKHQPGLFPGPPLRPAGARAR